MIDDPRTTEQLRAEITALERQIEDRGTVAGKWEARRAWRRRRAAKDAARAAMQPASPGSLSRLPAPVTRRSALAMWLAPMILLAPTVKSAKRLVKSVKRRVVA